MATCENIEIKQLRNTQILQAMSWIACNIWVDLVINMKPAHNTPFPHEIHFGYLFENTARYLTVQNTSNSSLMQGFVSSFSNLSIN